MSKRPLRHFLLVFDHRRGELVKKREFEQVKRAMTAYEEEEHRYRDEPLVEVVLIGSDSLDTVKLTHANYFDGTQTTSKYLVGL